MSLYASNYTHRDCTRCEITHSSHTCAYLQKQEDSVRSGTNEKLQLLQKCPELSVMFYFTQRLRTKTSVL